MLVYRQKEGWEARASAGKGIGAGHVGHRRWAFWASIALSRRAGRACLRLGCGRRGEFPSVFRSFFFSKVSGILIRSLSVHVCVCVHS